MSFTNAPVTRALVVGLICSSMAASLLDTKHYFYILVDTHIWRYRQLWRALAFQLCYANSSEVLFACMTFYHMRVIERMWGSQKFASFLITAYALTSLATPLLMIILRPLTAGLFNYLPAGPTPLLYAVLAQYHAIIPHIYRYRVATSSTPSSGDEPAAALTFSDKSYRYVLAGQLALFQWPGSLVGALVGWVAGYSWRNGVLPGAVARWRLPGWMVGMAAQKRSSAEFEGLRRRLEGEGTISASATGVQREEAAAQRRTMGQQILDQFQGAL